jgi:hypothetical protein
MSWAWRWRRAARMTPAEGLHRLREAFARRLARGRRFGWEAFPPRGTLRPLGGLAAPLRQQTDTLAPAVRAAAQVARAGAFSALGASWPPRAPTNLFPPDLWRLDPVSGQLWPGAFCFDIPYRHDSEGREVKHVWEINRLPFLPVLAADVALNGGDAGVLDEALASWRDANPPFQGLAWASGIELALRVVSVAVAVCWAGEAMAPRTLASIESLLRAHHDWLVRFPSLHSSANNHRVAEALGLLVAEALVPDLGDGAEARATLEREALKQIHSDGVGAEQSPTYAAFTVEMLSIADLFLRASGRPGLNAQVHARLAAFSGWIAWMGDAEGAVPRIGDDDEGRVLSLGVEPNYPAAVSGTLRAPCIRPPALRDAFRPPPPAPEGVQVFPQGGYSVVRERRAGRGLRLTFDHGPLGYLSIAAHGHADANSIWLSLDDAPIFVDAGTYLYHSGGDWRDAFRGTRAHNTLCLGGRDQSPIWGPFNWGPPARARLLAAEPGPDWRLVADHDGYVRRFGVRHRRELRATPGGFLLVDSLIGRPCATEAECSFQLAPGLAVTGAGLDWTVARGEQTLLRLGFGAPGEVVVFNGDETRRRGWVSPAFGVKQPAPQLVWRGRVAEAGLRVEFEL